MNEGIIHNSSGLSISRAGAVIRRAAGKGRAHSPGQSLKGFKTPSSHLCFTGFIGFWWQKNFLIHIQEVFAFHHFTPDVNLRVSHLYL